MLANFYAKASVLGSDLRSSGFPSPIVAKDDVPTRKWRALDFRLFTRGSADKSGCMLILDQAQTHSLCAFASLRDPGANLEPETSPLEPRAFYHRDHREKSEKDLKTKNKGFGVPPALLGVLKW